MNGYDTEIFEMHTIAGGVCTGWVRKGYTFDGCLHWLTGSAPTSSLYRMWEELGAVKGKRVINHEAFCHVVTPSGRRLVQWGNMDRLFEELKRIGPEDASLLEQLEAGRSGARQHEDSAGRSSKGQPGQEAEVPQEPQGCHRRVSTLWQHEHRKS